MMLCICDMRLNLMVRYIFLRHPPPSERFKFKSVRSIKDFNRLYKLTKPGIWADNHILKILKPPKFYYKALSSL